MSWFAFAAPGRTRLALATLVAAFGCARLAFTPLLLLGLGAVLYIAGAVVYALRRPDPWPRTFGFHEVFHGLVVVAAACHFAAMLVWIVPAGTPA